LWKGGPLHVVWSVIHEQDFNVEPLPGMRVIVFYPLVPWVGVMMLGYALGSVYDWPAARRKAFLVRLGVALTLAFLVVRGVDGYGDPAPWTAQRTPLFTVLSFLNATKYPPSLVFLLMTLGPALIALAWAEGARGAWTRPLVVFGRVPLFYYMVHFAVLHALATVVCLLRYGSAHWMFESPDLAHYPFSPPPGWGFGLPVVYLAWASVVIGVYPLCRWFAGVKGRRRDAWLSYL